MGRRAAAVGLISAVAIAAAARAQVSGTVVDVGTGQPLPRARVSLQASAVEVTAGDAGEFSLPLTDAGVVVGAVKGYFYGWAAVSPPATGVTLALEKVEAFDAGVGYLPALWTRCNYCHRAQVQDWISSPMGLAGKNTWVSDVYDGTGTPGGDGGFVYVRDSILAPHNPASECAACHQPIKWWDQPFTGLDLLDAGTDAVTWGVSCDICHKVADIDEGKPNYPGLFPGVVKLAYPDPDAGQQLQFGVLGDVTFQWPGSMRPAYQPQLRAQLCGLCHQDKNDPDEDGDFEEANGVVSEPTYLEWRESEYGDLASPRYQDCVDCHMPKVDARQACTEQFPELSRPSGDVRSHAFPGTTAAYLEDAVTLTLAATADAGVVEVAVTVHNDRTGHHVPTGVTIRNVVLLVEATSAGGGGALPLLDGETVHALGGTGDGGAARGYFAGLPGKLFAKVNHDAQGRGPAFFTEATGISWDNRLAPLASDVSRYRFHAPEGGPVEVRARLIYRRSWRALVDAKGWTTDGHGNPLEDLAPPHFGHLMESAEATLDVPAPPATGDSPALPNSCGCQVEPSSLALLAALGLALRRRRPAS
jgi:MYXO-CTERM domain-containing protein